MKTPQMFVLASAISVFVEENPSDPRPMVTRPAPDGHTTTARWSLGFSYIKTGKTGDGTEISDVGSGRPEENEGLAGRDEALG